MVSGLLAPPGEGFASRGVQEFSLGLAMAWVDQVCGGFFDKEQAGTLKPTAPGLCAAPDRRHRPHQRQPPSAAHNPALPIRVDSFTAAQ